jgi:hypothetical protein
VRRFSEFKLRVTGPNTLDAALVDRFYLFLRGLRLGEWAIRFARSDPASYKLAHRNENASPCMGDVR